MLDTLIEQYRKITSVAKRDDIIESVKVLMDSLNDQILPVLNNIIDGDKDSYMENSSTLTNMRLMVNIKTNTNMELVKKIRNLLKDMLASEKDLINVINQHVPEYVTNKTGSLRQLAILRVSEDYANTIMYILDFLYLTMNDNSDGMISKFKNKLIRNGISSFISFINVYYGNVNKIIKKLSKIDDTILNMKDVDVTVLESILTKGSHINFPTDKGYIGNPIVSFRLWMVDREINKIELLKDKKKLLEVRLLELRALDNNEPTDTIKGQIEYYEEKVSSLEYKITELEEND